MENINFIPADQLPETEGNEVSVLCVENGELKRKTASGLGGGGTYDIKLRIDAGDNGPVAEVLDGSFDAAAAKINDDEPGIVRVILDMALFGEQGKTVFDTDTALMGDAEVLMVTSDNLPAPVYILPDNTIEFGG